MQLIACPHCDALIELPPQLNHKQQVHCPRCHSYLFEQHRYGTQRCLSYSLTAMLLLIIAISFPFLTFEASGQSRTISLLEASIDLYLLDFWFLAILIVLFILVVPIAYLLSLIALLLARKGIFSKKVAVFAAKSLSHLIPWAMADVFIVGVLVALVKLIELAEIIIGTSFWAYLGFAMLFLLTNLMANQYQVWSWVEEIDGYAS